MPIYTKKGDRGMTKTFYGAMSKSDALAEALGSVDELNSWMGVFRTTLSGPPPSLGGGSKRGGMDLNQELNRVQTNLLTIGSMLAGSKKKISVYEVRRLEKLIDKLTGEMPKLSNFIYPVGYLQVARAVCRRAERRVVAFQNSKNEILSSKKILNIVKYLNRLSDALFTMARWVNIQLGVREERWKG